MSYWRYWRLNGAPFSGESSHPLFLGATVEEAVARIEFLITNRRSVGALLGPSGVGKSSILRYCQKSPPTSPEVPSVQTFRTSMIGLQGGELISELATRLTGDRNLSDRSTAWKVLCDYFRASAREGVQTVLLVDDTESSSTSAEADLCRLLAMSFPLTVIFAVESQLVNAVSRSLIDRIELQIELPGWEIMQTTEFLAWTCQSLGRIDPIFTDTAIERIQQLSGGIARRIVQLADLALVAGAVSQADCIDAACIEQVAWELPKTIAA